MKASSGSGDEGAAGTRAGAVGESSAPALRTGAVPARAGWYARTGGLLVFRPRRLLPAALALLAGLFCIVAPRLHRTLGQPLRAHGGDLALAVFLYLGGGAVTAISPRARGIAVLALLWGIELSQLIKSIPREGRVAEFTIGATFDYLDLLAYLLGVALAVWIERRGDRRAALP